MEDQKLECCCDGSGRNENCIVCGKPLVYFHEEKVMTCAVCGKEKLTNAACEDGHFVCDTCHSGGGAEILNFLRQSGERNPVALYLQVCGMEQVHLHGPEHHSIVPCVLITAYHNCGGRIELTDCLNEAWKRGKKVPGGACGFLGICGAAAGAGIFASILTEATPLTADVWDIPQRLTARCLERMVEIGGPRCCKRTGRIAVETAAEFSKAYFGVELPLSQPVCSFSDRNKECLHERCPYYVKEV